MTTQAGRHVGRRIFNILTTLFALTVTGACSSISVETDWDSEIDFSAFKSFALIDNPESKVNRLVKERIRAAIRTELMGKGLRNVDLADADLAVGFEVSTEQRTAYQTIYNGWGTSGYRSRSLSYGARVGPAQTIEHDYTVGTLVIAVFREEDKVLMWEGSGSGTVSPSRDPEENTRKINEAVQDILKGFPPGT